MTIRLLEPDEVALIADSDLGRAWPTLPSGGRVLVCEDHGRIVGHLALVPMLHVEGAYVDPAYRGRGVLDALVQAMRVEARAQGQHTVFPASASDQLTHFLERLGAVEIPAKWFALSVKES